MARRTRNSDTMKYILPTDTPLQQTQSRLFQIPGEVRQNIFQYALSSYEDMTRTYDKEAYHYRPQYLAPHKYDMVLLLTCKRIYEESWHIPLTSKCHTFWLTETDRAPAWDTTRSMSRSRFASVLQTIYDKRGDVEIDHVRFFAQMHVLSQYQRLTVFLQLPHFHPRCITMAIRHTDWDRWEDDKRLEITASWVNYHRFPDSLHQLKIELETLERKKDQLDSIVRQMKDSWHITRADEVKLTARDTPVEISRWKGSSIINLDRWLRDELEEEPGVLSYCIATITFQHEPTNALYPTTHPGNLSPESPSGPQNTQARITAPRPCIRVGELEAAGIPPGLSAQQTFTRLTELYNALSARQVGNIPDAAPALTSTASVRGRRRRPRAHLPR